MYQISISELYRRYLSSKGVSIDTRKIQVGEMFFCLKGPNFNANELSKKALELGASHVIIDEKEYYIDESTILVDDALETLQMLASFHRKQYNIPIIGITGTNGKTTTKELVNAVLSKEFKTHFTQGNFNNHIGVPLTLLSMPKDTEIAIIEMGANHSGEIAELCKIAEPNYGIITSLGKAHLEGFGSFENIIETKSALYKYVDQNAGKIFVNSDNQLLMKISENVDRITFGQKNADIKAEPINKNIFAALKWNEIEIQSQLVGSYNFENILAAIAVGNYFEISDDKIASAIENYSPTNNRSQLNKTNTNELIIDLYNANPSSMEAALKSFESIENTNKWMILGDMLELGTTSQQEHQIIVDNIIKNKNIKVVLIGKEFYSLAKTQIQTTFKNIEEASVWMKENPIENAVILLKGSRGIALENLIQYL